MIGERLTKRMDNRKKRLDGIADGILHITNGALRSKQNKTKLTRHHDRQRCSKVT